MMFNELFLDNVDQAYMTSVEKLSMKQVIKAQKDSAMALSHVHAFVKGLLWTSGIIVTLLLFFILGPRVEDDLFPAFGPVSITVVERDATDRHEFLIVGDVLRDCKYLRIGAMVNVNGVWQAGHVKTPDIPPDFMIPKGRQNFGRLRIYPKGDGVRVIVENQCHPLWINHTYYYWP